MIDLLLQYGVPALFRALSDTTEKAQVDEKATLQNQIHRLASAVRQATETDKKQAEMIAGILKELQGLTPLNVNPQLETIYDWMERHVNSETALLRKLVKKQRYWNYGMGAATLIAFGIAIFSLYGR